MAAAAAVLLPEHSMSTSQGADVSLARHRRRQSSRRSGTMRSLKSKGPGDRTLNLSQLEPDNRNFDLTPSTQPSETELTASIASDQVTENGKDLRETARQRRTRTRRRDPRISSIPHPSNNPQPTPASHGPLNLEDSTAGVASLLKKKLNQSDLEELQHSQSDQVDGDTVIPNPATELTTGVESDDDTVTAVSEEHGNGGDEHLQQEVDEAGEGGEIAPDRPLPQLVPVTDDSEGAQGPENTSEILGITIHGCDALKASVHISHPCVRVSIIDTSDEARGTYAKKSHYEKCVMSFYERGNPAVDYIMPILTQPFESKEQSNNLLPMWDETLIFNEHPTHFTANQKLVIFFEILDFSTTSRTTHPRVTSDSSPWYKIAWAFVCPAGKIGNANIGQKCRLQLYRYPKRLWKRTTKDNEVFDLWERNYRVMYPSTLYVTLKVLPIEQLEHGQSSPLLNRRSMLPTQREEGSVTFEQLLLRQHASRSSSNLLTQSAVFSTTARLPNQACQIPTSPHATVHPTKMGCSTLAFSHSGTLLAAGCADQDVHYPMVIFEVPSFKPLIVTEGHRGIIYSVCWKQDDQLLATASADGLVKLWSLESASHGEPIATLPHPCYVYSVCFASGGLIFTGAYDSNIRVWSISSGSPQLHSELRGCSGLVNCLVWSSKEGFLYAGDSKGRVCVWKEDGGKWAMQRIISAVKNGALTSISLHPNGRKLLLHTDRGRLVMVDLRIDRVCCEYKGLVVSQSQRFSSLISPCGGLIFAGGANGEVHVWNSDSGKHLHSYFSTLPFQHCAMCAMDYHPNEHMLVLSAFGTHEPIVVLTHLMQDKVEDNTSARVAKQTTESGTLTAKHSTQLRMTQRLNEATKMLSGVTLSGTRSKRKQNQ